MPKAKPLQPYKDKKTKSGEFKIFIFCRAIQHEKCPGFIEYEGRVKGYKTHKRYCKCACHGKTRRLKKK